MPAALQPLRVSAGRVFVESIGGYLLLILLSVVVGPLYQVGYLWLPLWTAWRLRRHPVASPWLNPIWSVARGIAVGVGMALLLGLLTTTVWSHLVPAVPRHGTDAWHLAWLAALLYWTCRSSVIVVAAVRRFIRRRLRRQLMASQIALALMLTVLVVALGSVGAVTLGVDAITPDATTMAMSVRGLIESAGGGGPPRPATVRHLLMEIGTEQIEVAGTPLLARVLDRQVVPTLFAYAYVGPDGAVIAQTTQGAGTAADDRLSVRSIARQHPDRWHTLLRAARRRTTYQVSLPATTTGDIMKPVAAEVPIIHDGNLVGMVVVDVGQPSISSLHLLQGELAVFGIATFLLVGLSAVPIFALAFGFSWLMARSLTRHLESLSRVTTAIAGGDLTQRASVEATNEIGDLAVDINLMASNLERAVGDLRDARAQAESALRARQTLTANISHELRTPLAIMRAHLDSLTQRSGAPAGSASDDASDVLVPRDAIDALHGETERLAGLIDDLFSLSRAEAGALPVQAEAVDVGAITDDVVHLMRPLVQREGALTLTARVSPGLPAALCDSDRLRQILTNLLRNAARHTPEGGIIAVTVDSDVRHVVLRVADTGEGIPPEHLPHVFERLYRVDEARTRAAGGAGLGLAIVREFVEAMQGSVEVESAPGEGTVFTVRLRRATSP
jgi:signal transduction histidine kinase